MAHIVKAATTLAAGLLIGACSNAPMHSASSGARFPQGQCELETNSSPGAVPLLISTCANDGVGSNSSALLRLAKRSRIFLQKDLERANVLEGIKLTEEVLASYAAGERIGGVEANNLPDEAKRLLEQPLYVFIAAAGDQVRVSFDSNSDALVMYRQADGSIAADYVIY